MTDSTTLHCPEVLLDSDNDNNPPTQPVTPESQMCTLLDSPPLITLYRPTCETERVPGPVATELLQVLSRSAYPAQPVAKPMTRQKKIRKMLKRAIVAYSVLHHNGHVKEWDHIDHAVNLAFPTTYQMRVFADSSFGMCPEGTLGAAVREHIYGYMSDLSTPSQSC
jgi:hypothetical protein